MSDDPHELWEITCTNLGQTDGIPLAVFGGSETRLFDDHPLLWDTDIYFFITGTATDIAGLMGNLFIEHANACGGWVDFHWLYSGLLETLRTLRENQLSIPTSLKEAC